MFCINSLQRRRIDMTDYFPCKTTLKVPDCSQNLYSSKNQSKNYFDASLVSTEFYESKTINKAYMWIIEGVGCNNTKDSYILRPHS